MGGQVAALLSGPPPYGVVPAEQPVTGRLRLAAPDRYSLDATARSTGSVAMPPTSYDGLRLNRVLPGGTVRVGPDLAVACSGAPVEVEPALTTVLGLQDDPTELWEGCAQVPSLAWVPAAGAGRVLRAPTVWEDLVGLLAATGTSFRSARAALGRLVGAGPFPAPDVVAALGESGLRACGLGYRAGPLADLARRVAEGRLDPESWRALADEEAYARVVALPGFGPFSAAALLPLLGRPRPLLLDRWLRAQLPGLTEPDLRARYSPLGRWAGTGLWLEVSGRWLRHGSRTSCSAE